MEKVVVEQFLNCYQKFINLCQLDNWPNDDTTPEQIKKAFLLSQHIEKCTCKLIKNNLYDGFYSILNEKLNASSLLLKNCLSAPQKYILKKLITSSTHISKMDVGFNIFLDLFSEEQLETYLSDIMLEVASKDTLFRNICSELSKSSQLEFNSQLFLTKLHCEEDCIQVINELTNNCTQEVVDMLVLCSLNKNLKYGHSVKIIVNGFVKIMSSRNVIYKNFWKLLFRTEEHKFMQMCLSHSEIFILISQALIDCGKLYEKNMLTQYFYIELTYSELSCNIHKICKDSYLKSQFLDLLNQSNVDLTFWERELKDS